MIRIESNISQVIKNLEKIPGRIDAKAKKVFEREGKRFIKEVQAEQFSGQKGKRFLNRITGKAKAGWKLFTSGTKGDFKFRIVNKVFYVAIHENQTHRLRLAKAFKDFFKDISKLMKKELDGK